MTGEPDRPQVRFSAPEPVTPQHDLSNFDCGDSALNDWLKQRALRNESRFSRTYVVLEGDRIAGYFCISAGSVERMAAPGRLRRNAPDAIPVSVIGRLAVSLDHSGRGLGADMLSDALRRIAVASKTIGIAAVLVHAKDERAKRFYLACAEFTAFPANGLTLFLPIDTVISGLE